MRALLHGVRGVLLAVALSSLPAPAVACGMPNADEEVPARLVGYAVERSDPSSPGSLYYALAVNGVRTDGSIAASEGGRIEIPLAEKDEGVFVLHSSCDCEIVVQALHHGRVVAEETATGAHTVARVRFGPAVVEAFEQRSAPP